MVDLIHVSRQDLDVQSLQLQRLIIQSKMKANLQEKKTKDHFTTPIVNLQTSKGT